MTTYSYLVDVYCALDNGQNQTLHGLPIDVQAQSLKEAEAALKGAAADYVGNRGNALTSAPVVDVDVVRVHGVASGSVVMEIVWEDAPDTLEEHASVNGQRVASVGWNFAYNPPGDDRYLWRIGDQTGFALTLDRAKALVEDRLREVT